MTCELVVRLVPEAETAEYNALMAAHHRLGVAASGRVLRYVAEAGGVPVVLATFGSAAWRLPVRDARIGWDEQQRSARLERICCNQRLCVLPAAEDVPHAGSQALAAMLRALPGDYQRVFGVRLMAVESFTDPATHAGTVYAAANFTAAGSTAGYGRSAGPSHYIRHGQPKTYWLYELAGGGIAALAAGFDSPVLTGCRAPDFNTLEMGAGHGLLAYLGKVADHRKAKGIRHDLAAILAVIVVARLSGANSVYAAAQFAATMPQEALRRCGIRYSTRLGRHVPPSPKTIKRAVRAVDAAAADEQMCAWLRAEAAAGRLNWRHIAVDGKTVRGAVQHDGTRPHLLAGYDVTTGTVLGQDSVHAKTNEITCFVPLLHAILNGRSTPASNGPQQRHQRRQQHQREEKEKESELVILTADAMHTQAGHVTAMNALSIGWILTLKDNQPGLYAAADAHPWHDEPCCTPPARPATAGTRSAPSAPPARSRKRSASGSPAPPSSCSSNATGTPSAAAPPPPPAAKQPPTATETTSASPPALPHTARKCPARPSWQSPPSPPPRQARSSSSPATAPTGASKTVFTTAATPPSPKTPPAAGRPVLAAIRRHRQHHRQRPQPRRLPQPRRRPPRPRLGPHRPAGPDPPRPVTRARETETRSQHATSSPNTYFDPSPGGTGSKCRIFNGYELANEREWPTATQRARRARQVRGWPEPGRPRSVRSRRQPCGPRGG